MWQERRGDTAEGVCGKGGGRSHCHKQPKSIATPGASVHGKEGVGSKGQDKGGGSLGTGLRGAETGWIPVGNSDRFGGGPGEYNMRAPPGPQRCRTPARPTTLVDLGLGLS